MSRGAPPSFKEGKLDPYNLRNRTEEERKEISRKGVEARRRKKAQRMELQNIMEALLSSKTNSNKEKQKLREFGFTSDDATNGAVLMLSLLKSGISGDIQATKEIVRMMETLDMYKETGEVSYGQGITVNVFGLGDRRTLTDEEMEEIARIERGEELQ